MQARAGRPIRTRLGALLLGVALVASGCWSGEVVESSDEPGPTSPTSQESSPSTTPTPAASEPGVPALEQVCALVTTDEIEAIIGVPVTEGVVQDVWGQQCLFETQDGVVGNGSVALAVAPGIRDGVEVSPTPLVSGFPVGGFEADWHQDTGLVVVVDDEQVPWLLHTLVRLDQRNRQAKSVELAELVLSRLPLLRMGQRVCTLFGADDFEAVFDTPASKHHPQLPLFEGRAVLAECLLDSPDGAVRLDFGAYLAHFERGSLAPIEPGSRAVTDLGPGAYWNPRNGVSVDLAEKGLVWLHVAASWHSTRPDRALTMESARLILERLDS